MSSLKSEQFELHPAVLQRDIEHEDGVGSSGSTDGSECNPALDGPSRTGLARDVDLTVVDVASEAAPVRGAEHEGEVGHV